MHEDEQGKLLKHFLFFVFFLFPVLLSFSFLPGGSALALESGLGQVRWKGALERCLGKAPWKSDLERAAWKAGLCDATTRRAEQLGR